MQPHRAKLHQNYRPRWLSNQVSNLALPFHSILPPLFMLSILLLAHNFTECQSQRSIFQKESQQQGPSLSFIISLTIESSIIPKQFFHTKRRGTCMVSMWRISSLKSSPEVVPVGNLRATCPFGSKKVLKTLQNSNTSNPVVHQHC